MAYERDPHCPITLDGSTGLRQFRAVTMSTAGLLTYPTASTVGQPIIGTITGEGSTGSTTSPQAIEIQPVGPIVKLEGETGVSVGTWVSASTVGRVQTSTNAGDSVIGFCVAGSTGAANTVYSVMLTPLGSSVAPS